MSEISDDSCPTRTPPDSPRIVRIASPRVIRIVPVTILSPRIVEQDTEAEAQKVCTLLKVKRRRRWRRRTKVNQQAPELPPSHAKVEDESDYDTESES